VCRPPRQRLLLLADAICKQAKTSIYPAPDIKRPGS
jgi:hypothetical protein